MPIRRRLSIVPDGAIIDEGSSSSSEEEGWEDAEAESEDEAIFKSFFDIKEFPSLANLLKYTKAEYGLDLIAICDRLTEVADQVSKDLDTVGIIRLINYLRINGQSGTVPPPIKSQDDLNDDKYLVPVIEDDTVLIHVGDIEDLVTASKGRPRSSTQPNRRDDASKDDLIDKLKEQVEQLGAQLGIAKKALETGYVEAESRPSENDGKRDDDSHYFKSYDNNGIHETMLQDRVRTDAYRDFIYNNKDLFKDKVVLDLGCGTGILSMFCAKAGAKKVFAVDNSEIVHKATQNAFDNRLDLVITCIHGKIEEIELPVDEVDIIVSEWMGYCLLYEAMLESVLWARDKWLKLDGLMVPSYCTLRVAPVSDPDFIYQKVSFWNDVYGFKMRSMLDKVDGDVAIRTVAKNCIIGTACEFLQLSLHDVEVEDLTFADKPFRSTLQRHIDMLDGFAIWFDIFFDRTRKPAAGRGAAAAADTWPGKQEGEVAFTTGPFGKPTHWEQGMLMIKRLHTRDIVPLNKGQVIAGTIGYSKSETNSRELEISVSWDTGEPMGSYGREKGDRTWPMR